VAGRRAAPRILHVEDEAPIRLICRFHLELAGMEVVEAADGRTGLERARRELPDLILLGVMMPGLDGWSVAEMLLDDPATREIPIVFLTTRSEFRDRAKGLALGAVEYLTMPFDPLELPDVIREVLERVDRGEREQLRRERLAELRGRLEA
jgi:CRP/FNR family transcriptional regulator, polysaccharide utilization system transcription regulator